MLILNPNPKTLILKPKRLVICYNHHNVTSLFASKNLTFRSMRVDPVRCEDQILGCK